VGNDSGGFIPTGVHWAYTAEEENVASNRIPERVNAFDPTPPRYIKFLPLIITKARQYDGNTLRSTLYHLSMMWNATAADAPNQRTDLCKHVLRRQQNAKVWRQIFALETITSFSF
jgi:hypothetical protein